ncbi:MAG: tetratricopeptide repeat protein [Rhodospirillaceae bacterium]
MSVLYKALQKAEKENEERQAEAGGGFDPQRLAGSGAIGAGRGKSLNWRVTGLAAAVVLAVAIGAAFFLVQPPTGPQTATVQQPAPQTPSPVLQPPAAAPSQAAQSPTSAEPRQEAATTDVSPSDDVQQQVADVPAPEQPAPVSVSPDTETVDAAESQTAAAPVQDEQVAPATVARTSSPQSAADREPMPQLAADSPARRLSPPISIDRGGFALAGVGDAVQVRRVSQQAQDNASAGYNALIRGEFDTALEFYNRALEQEPESVLALLGRGSALQKLSRSTEAQAAYNAVLRLDPKNREALTNLTTIVSERSPAEALAQLQELERDYPNFSPVTAQIGLAHAKMGAMPQARDYLRRAVAMSPGAVMYHYNLALVLDHMNLGDQAIRSYENVLAAIAGGRNVSGLSSTDIERRVRYLRTR